MPVIDLKKVSSGIVKHADFCIVGYGAIGIPIASEILKHNKSVIIIEAGPMDPVLGNEIGVYSNFSDAEYLGSNKGRYFGVGGSTGRWGGALGIPEKDHTDNLYGADIWKHITETTERNYKYVLNSIGVHQDLDFKELAYRRFAKFNAGTKDLGIDLSCVYNLPFAKRNFSKSIFDNIRKSPKFSLIYNSVLTSFDLKKSGDLKIQSFKAKSINSNELTIIADKFIIAAGAIESARILLELDNHLEGTLYNKSYKPGDQFTDHLSTKVGAIINQDLSKAKYWFSPFFLNSAICNFRFFKRDSSKITNRGFFHFIVDSEAIGLSYLKDYFSKIQRGKKANPLNKNLLIALIDLIYIGFFKIFFKRLVLPKTSNINLHLDIEQSPINKNSFSLSNELDVYGRNKLIINWKISSDDVKQLKALANDFVSSWNRLSLSFPKIHLSDIDISTKKIFDAYHPVSTCKIGTVGYSALDENLKVHQLENLWVYSTGVLPSAGYVNPTFTALCISYASLKGII